MTQKNIAFIVKYFPTVSETFIVNQINALIDVGHHVTLYSYNKTDNTVIHNSLLKHQLVNNVNYFVKPSQSKLLRLINAITWVFKHGSMLNWSLLFKSINVFKYGKQAYTLKLFYEIQWFLLKNDFNIIHAHFGMNAKRIASLKHLEFLPENTKLVTTFHGYDLLPNKEAYYQENYKNIFKFSSAITVNTQYMYALLKSIRKDIDTISILPVGTNTSYFKPSMLKNKTTNFEIAFCGKLIPLKGADLTVKILKRIHEIGYENVRLNLIGNGNLFDDIKVLINNLGLAKSVTMFGAVSQEEMKNILDGSDVFLLPGRYDPKTKRAETQGLVLQEAQAMELPVVVSDVGGMKYGLIDGETGFIVKENDIDEFANCIATLILDETLKLEMGKKGRKFVTENYDNKVLLKKLIMIYNDVIEDL